VILTDSWADCDIRYPPGDTWNDCGKNLYGALKQMYLHKKANRNLKILLSIGGWTYTQERKHLDGPASTPEGRKRFADSCVTLIKDLGFDGIDVDWEYPNSPEQGQQLLLLLREIRAAMDAYAETLPSDDGERPHFLLTIAAPAGEQNYRNYPLKEVAETLDFINLMVCIPLYLDITHPAHDPCPLPPRLPRVYLSQILAVTTKEPDFLQITLFTRNHQY
jgi:chitinase